jgi:hypothetical protein
MSRVTLFRAVVRERTGGDPRNARRFGQYLIEMGVTRASWASARAQLIRAMNQGGPLEDLVRRRRILPDEANRQPKCFRNGGI